MTISTGPTSPTSRATVRSLLLALVAVLAAIVTLIAPLPGPSAQAICKDPPCTRPEDPGPKPPPAPVKTTITGVSPGFGWSGDVVTLSGTGLKGASVTVDGIAVTPSSQTGAKLTLTVPTITKSVVGPQTVTIAVSSPTGQASTGFVLSPSLQVTGHASYGVNAQFDQGMDGRADAVATLDRSSGMTVSTLTVANTQMWLPLIVNLSTVWLDDSNRVIGFTSPRGVTAWGAAATFPSSGPFIATGHFSAAVGPNPGVAPFARSARVILVRDHEAELLATLQSAVDTAEQIASVISKLAPFFV